MNIYFNPNIPEMRSIFLFNRVSLEISEIARRIETGQRILSGKDDPAGLLSREIMRADIRGIQSAQKNTMQSNELLATADSGLSNISQMLMGDINNRDDKGILGLIYDDTVPSDMKRQIINDILNLIDGTIRSTTYNGKQLLDGSQGYRYSGVDPLKLSDVSVSKAAFDTAQGLPVTVKVLEQPKQAILKMDARDIDLDENFTLELTGTSGDAPVMAWGGGDYNAYEIVREVNSYTDSTGVQARMDGTSIVFETSEIGDEQNLSVAVSNGANDKLAVTNLSGERANTDTGRSNVLAEINGQQTEGKGQKIEYSSGSLVMSATISPSMKVGETTQFNVAGGMLFQLGKDVQTPLQYRMVLPNMTTSGLGGASGRLYELRSMDWDSDDDKARAYAIVNEAINMVAVQRGTIGAVQKSVLGSNAQRLDTQLESVSEAEALISNADIAVESSRLNRAEILTQAAMSSILHARSFERFIVGMLL